MVEATGFSSIESRSSSMSSRPYNISSKSTKLFKSYCTHLRSLNVRHFGMAKATRLKNVTSRSPWMAVPAYQISRKFTDRFKSIGGDTDRQTHSLSISLSHTHSLVI
jgi:hypothetical protein